MRTPLAGLLAATVASATLTAQLHVDAAAAPNGNGQSWATAYQTVQAALAAAGPGQSVWVAAGSYAGGFVLPADVALLGGFEPGMRRADQARPHAHPTVLDGQGTQRVVLLGQHSTLDGFVLQNGDAAAPGGGGALIDGVDATIRRCVFTANNNSGGRGAALAIRNGADPLIADCVFHHNTNSGHTIDVDLGASGTYEHITVADNPHNGLHMQGTTSCDISNSLFVRNQGRGICDVGPSNAPTLRNCMFWQNGVSLMHYRGSELNSATAVNALPYASGNLEDDPRFVAANDYRLAGDSPAIDAGIAHLDPRLELGGAPRVNDGDLDGTMLPDLGAHEHTDCVLAAAGGASAGSTLMLQLGSPAGAFGGIAMLFPGPTTTVAPFGTAYGSSPVAVILGFLPGALAVPIPAGLSVDLVFQGFCFGANGAGNLG
ncbi:MAG: right-handed parallel beta-helix repeat-containing protein, partial [Planctomycetes bacterium]|nr:right-handed parallel beta-helix repeat-containing protein [Planctomycetota bacterium]